MRRAGSGAFFAACALVLVACGARVPPLEQAGVVVPTGGAVPTSGPATGLPTAGPSATAIPTTGTGPIPFDPVTPANCKPGKGDVGVTDTTIKLGLIASKTGPLPGQFDSAVEAVDAYFKGLNEAGGICGRLVDLEIRDDGGNGNNNLQLAESLAREEKIFAFVGSHSAPDDSGIAKVSKRDRIPDIGFPLTWERAENPFTYGVPGIVQKNTIGVGATGSKYLNKVNDIKQIALFWLKESEVSILNAWAFEAAMMKATNNGLTVCHEQPAGVLDNNYTNYVVSMQGNCRPENGNVAVYSTMENNANIKLAKAMKGQGFKPKVFAPTFTSYLPSFIEDAEGATEGAYIAMPQIPIERLQAPESTWSEGTYELKRYLDTLYRFVPRPHPPGSFGGPAWAQAALFTEAAARCGPDLTRDCLFRKLDTMGPFSDHGFVAPNDPASHHVYTADLIVQVRDGRFTEIRPNDRSGPKLGPDFWDDSELFDWQKYYCANKGKFPNTAEKDALIDAC
ncbi:MAG TPA: ABC transporter substrate-binding protein [Actinomycetota bacterium]